MSGDSKLSPLEIAVLVAELIKLANTVITEQREPTEAEWTKARSRWQDASDLWDEDNGE